MCMQGLLVRIDVPSISWCMANRTQSRVEVRARLAHLGREARSQAAEVGNVSPNSKAKPRANAKAKKQLSPAAAALNDFVRTWNVSGLLPSSRLGSLSQLILNAGHEVLRDWSKVVR